MEVPAIMPTSMPSSSRAFSTPIWAQPRAAPPPSARAIFVFARSGATGGLGLMFREGPPGAEASDVTPLRLNVQFNIRHLHAAEHSVPHRRAGSVPGLHSLP